MTKHTDSSRSTDSGVSGNAQTSELEIRNLDAPNNSGQNQGTDERAGATSKAANLRAEEWLRRRIKDAPDPHRLQQVTYSSRKCSDRFSSITKLLSTYAESECSRLASRVEELEEGLHQAEMALSAAVMGLAATDDLKYALECVTEGLRSVKLLAGAHAEEKE